MLELQNFEQDSFSGDPACSWNGGGWTPTSFEWQGCATNEGWASYVAGVSWWDPGVAASHPFYLGFDMENTAPADGTCGNNAWIPGQVARAFWDLDDLNNELGQGITAGSNDTQTLDTITIAQAWDGFPDGTANRQDRENNNNGVNARDYDGNFNVDDTTFLNHNCIQSQDN